MNKNWIIVIVILLIIAGIVIANKNVLDSAESLNFFQCKPNWKLITEYAPNEEYCNTWCYQGFNSNHFKLEDNFFHSCICKLSYVFNNKTFYNNVTLGISQEGNYTQECRDVCKRTYNTTEIETQEELMSKKCYCDINNCK
jgi:hypothetical protein